MDKDGRKQENTEQVRSLVLKFLPNIRMCVTPNTTATCSLNIPPGRCKGDSTPGLWRALDLTCIRIIYIIISIKKTIV